MRSPGSDDVNLESIRAQFPALGRTLNGQPFCYLDGPAGTQVPLSVIDAVRRYFEQSNANHGGYFATSVESDRMLDSARQAAADLFGADDPQTIVFGPNMTTITFQLSHVLRRTWSPGDEIIVSDSDHDANVTPWVLAAEEAGVRVQRIRLRREDCTLDLDDFQKKLSPRTRLVAVGCASNATGTIHPVQRIVEMAHRAGALVFLDAVHYAPHGPIDVAEWGTDFLVASAYKFFGPHVGILWGRRELLESLPARKVRPASNDIPDRWMTGTQSHEGIAGTLAAIEYLARLAPSPTDSRRAALVASMNRIADYERELVGRLIAGVLEKPGFKVWGITDPAQFHQRVPTISITHESESPESIARRLADAGIFVWSGNFYAQPLTEALGLEPAGMVRIGLVHYNTAGEVDRLLHEL